MIITINKKKSRLEAKKEISDALQRHKFQNNKKKSEILNKLSGLLSRLKMSPMEIQKEMREGWNE
jgi:hypothetical protein